jgi:hypothetical protein
VQLNLAVQSLGTKRGVVGGRASQALDDTREMQHFVVVHLHSRNNRTTTGVSIIMALVYARLLHPEPYCL